MDNQPATYDHTGRVNTLDTAAYLVELECNCLRIVVGGTVPQIGDDIQYIGSFKQVCNEHVGNPQRAHIKRVFRIFPVIPTVNPLMLDERTE